MMINFWSLITETSKIKRVRRKMGSKMGEYSARYPFFMEGH
jgi:hypothetical protein